MNEETSNGHFDRILVVDDTTANLQLLTNLLTGHGYTVYPASDGELALEFVRTTLPDLILLDIRMPGMDGFEVCRQLKADERTRDIPVIFISILEDERDKVKGFREGAVDYITKPFQPEEVLARIGIHLRLRELTGRLEQKVAERTEELTIANQLLQQEVVERKRAEEEQRRLNRELKAISNCNQVLMRAEDEQTLLNDVCRIVCEDAGYRMAWVGYAEYDEAKTVRPVAWGGVEDGYLAKANITWADTERGRGPSGKAIRTGESACISDFLTDPEAAPWRENALKRCYRSSIAMPLKDKNSDTFGVMTIYSTEPNAFSSEEIRLLEELAGDVSFGITVLRTRIERNLAEEALLLRNRINEIFLTFPGNEMYDEVLKVVLQAMKSRHGVFAYIDEDGAAVAPSLTGDVWEKCQMPGKSVVFPRETWGGNIWGYVLTEGKSVYTNEPFVVPEGHIPINGALDVPILYEKKVIGHFLVGNKETDYDNTDKEKLEDIAAAVSAVLAARLQRDRQEKQRRTAETALEKIATEWSAAIDASSDVVYLLDLNRIIVRANKAFYAMTGTSPETATGRHIAEIVHPKGEHELCPVCTAQEEKRDAIIIMEADDPNNPFGRPVEYTVRIVRDKLGQPVSIFMTLHDLTHDRKIQEEKIKLETQLFQAQKMEAIGQLAGGIAHDFNNMLTAIIGYGSMLKDKLDHDSSLKLFAEQILSSAEKSANLTRQLLAFSRKQLISPKETNLNELIKGMEKLLLRLIGEDIEFKTELTDKALTVMVDPGQMEQVLMNLCTNARDAMPEGGLLSIKTDAVQLDEAYRKNHELEKPGMYAWISVSDSGKGMDEKTLNKIFEPFFTTKEIGKGTGLGLSIVYGIIKQHGGNITAYSEPGKGSTFKIYLPLIKSLGLLEAMMAAVEVPKKGTETILMVEDNEDVRTFSRRLLEEYGYTVIEASDGEEAVRKFMENKEDIQLVILDVIMPKKSGKEAADEIKDVKPDARILFTSGYTADIIHQKGIPEEGMNFISKPANPHDLLIKIREVLDGN